MKNILLTGADGFIGSHVAEQLVRLGYQVRATVLYNSLSSNGWLDTIDPAIKSALEIIPGDIRDSGYVRKIMKGSDAVLHLAALVSVPYSYLNPESYIQTNVMGTLNILQAAKENQDTLQKMIHTSTSEVYGTAQTMHSIPMTEDHPLNAQSPYAASKIAADQLALSFYHSFQTPVTIIRPFNTYGPRQTTRAVIPTILTQMLREVPSIALGSLTPTRDFTFVEDIAEGMCAALNAKNTEGEVIHLGSQFEISIADTVEIIAKVLNKKPNIYLDEKRVRPEGSEVFRLCASNEKAKRLLNWVPKHGKLEGFVKGIQKTCDWYSCHLKNTHFFENSFHNAPFASTLFTPSLNYAL